MKGARLVNTSREHIQTLPMPMFWKNDHLILENKISSSGFSLGYIDNEEYVGSFLFNKEYYAVSLPDNWWKGQDSYHADSKPVEQKKKDVCKEFTLPSVWNIKEGDYREPMNKEDEIKVINYKKIWRNAFITSLFVVCFLTIVIVSLVAGI